MKKSVIIVVALFWMTTAFAQDPIRALEEFSSLKVSNGLKVVLIQGTENKVALEGVALEDLEKIKTEITNGQLSIFRKGNINSKNNLSLKLTFKHLKRIDFGGAASISTIATIKEKDFAVKGSGAIEAYLNIEATNLTIDVSGASDIKLKGFAENLTISSSGASDVKAKDFIAQHILIDVSGASDIKVHAVESITGKASGASSVSVSGSPKIRAINSGGASSVSVGNSHVVISTDDVNVKVGNKQVIVIDDGDTTKVKWGGTEFVLIDDSIHISKKHKSRRKHWAGVDLGINGFMNSSNSFDLRDDVNASPSEKTGFMELNYQKSWSFSINFMEFYIPIVNNRLGLVTGMGTEWNNYELKHNIKLNPIGGRFVHASVDEFNQDYTWGEVDTVLTYSKNRFKTWFVNAPLLLQLNTGDHKNKSFHISAGAIFGFNLQTKMKYKYFLNGDNKKEKDKQSFNTYPFRVSATVRAGVGWFNLFATYSLTQLFEDGRGPEIYPFTVGVTLLGF